MRLNLADLHIGLEPDGRVERTINWCEEHKPDEIVLHGDTFHANELGNTVFATKDFALLGELRRKTCVLILLGNHDWQLADPSRSAGFLSVAGCPIVAPFVDEVGYYHSHWHEFDVVSKMPKWWHMLMARFNRSRTPRILKEQDSTAFWYYCQAIHTRAAEWAFRQPASTLIGGHTHMPMDQHLLDSGVDLWNAGDMLDSFTGIRQDEYHLEFVNL